MSVSINSESSSQQRCLRLTGLTCADCASKLEQRLAKLPGVEHARLNFTTAKLELVATASRERIVQEIEAAGYSVAADCAAQVADRESTPWLRTHLHTVMTAVSACCLLLAWILSLAHVPAPAAEIGYTLALIIGGTIHFVALSLRLRARQADMNVLMIVAVIGAIGIRQWEEAASVAVLFSISNLLEAYSMERTRRSLRSLMELAPREALVRREGREMRIAAAEVTVGDLVIVKPGEKIPIDGRVEAGASAVNQAAITGESMPVEKAVGDTVYSGTLNTLGAMEIRATARAEDSRLAHIVHLVEEAQGQRAPAQAFVDRFAEIYTPVVIALAVVVALVPPLLFAQPWSPWIYNALALLIIACPCALVISTPVAIVSAIGNAARHGVLIKGGAYLETAARITAVAFDKTGTLTIGRPAVTDVIPLDGVDRQQLLALAAAVEDRASHPLAEAILQAAREEGLVLPHATAFATIPGRGVSATVGEETVYIGTAELFATRGIATTATESTVLHLQDEGKTVMLVGTDTGLLGVIAAADVVRPESADVVAALHRVGIKQVIMVTGDHAGTARALAHRLGVDKIVADAMPEDKVRVIRDLQASYGAVAMVGDGINDAPALATADVGIAMGAAGTDTALETADIALMNDDLYKVPYTIALSRKARRVIKQNIAIALGLKTLALLLLFPGWLTLWFAVIADMGASLLVTLNGLRLVQEVKPVHEPQAVCHDECCGSDGCH